MSSEFDYLYRFPLSGLPLAITGFAALQAAGLLDAGEIPPNMLGDPRDGAGNIVIPGAQVPVAWVGRQGTAAMSYVDRDSGHTVSMPARGDPGYWYVAIRAEVPPDQVTVNPADYGLIVCDPVESAAVLGGWE